MAVRPVRRRGFLPHEEGAEAGQDFVSMQLDPTRLRRLTVDVVTTSERT
jgi:hypothetical protein